jgi:hypothetical protein
VPQVFLTVTSVVGSLLMKPVVAVGFV